MLSKKSPWAAAAIEDGPSFATSLLLLAATTRLQLQNKPKEAEKYAVSRGQARPCCSYTIRMLENLKDSSAVRLTTDKPTKPGALSLVT